MEKNAFCEEQSKGYCHNILMLLMSLFAGISGACLFTLIVYSPLLGISVGIIIWSIYGIYSFIYYSCERMIDRNQRKEILEGRMITFYKTQTIDEYRWIMNEVVDLGHFDNGDVHIWIGCLLNAFPEFYQGDYLEDMIIDCGINVQMSSYFNSNFPLPTDPIDLRYYMKCAKIRLTIIGDSNNTLTSLGRVKFQCGEYDNFYSFGYLRRYVEN